MWSAVDDVGPGGGLTNKAIASRLVVSRRRAEGHVEHILTKLGSTSRAQIATWASEQADVWTDCG